MSINFVISADEDAMALHLCDKHVLRTDRGVNSIVV
jgi:hypothetical protein